MPRRHQGSASCHTEFRRTHCHMYPGPSQRGYLVCRSSAAARDNRSCMTHPTPLGGRLSSNKGDHGLLEVLLNEFRGVFLGGAANFADHYYWSGSWIRVEGAQNVDKARANSWVAADTHTC